MARSHITALSLLLGALLAAGCASPSTISTSTSSAPPASSQESTVTTATALGGVEIRSYKGQRLDAVASEPENSIKGPQHVDIRTYRLAIGGRVSNPLSLTYAQVTGMQAYQKATTLHCIEGWTVTYLWQGVRIRDILARAGYDPTAKIVIFTCADGYRTSLSLDYIVRNDILLAYRMNGVKMPPERGFPFQVVAEDVYGYKWAKWVTRIDVSDDTSFRGFWEQRGYDNAATLPAGVN